MSRVSRTGIVMGIVRERTAYGKLQTAALCCNVNYETKTRETSERRREERQDQEQENGKTRI